MVRHKEHSSSSSVSRRKDLKPLTNGEVVDFLTSLPGNRPFGILEERKEREFLRQLYLPLHNLFKTTTTTSRANRTRIQEISRLEVLDSLYSRFPQFERDPLEFWERLIKALPQYSQQRLENRARTFLEGAALLDSNIGEQRILQRFVAVSAYNLFRRAIPTSKARVLTKNIKEFLYHMGIPSSESDISKYGNIIRRGQRHAHFCQKLEADTAINNGDGVSDDGDNQDEATEDYGPLFFFSIPDSIWDEKGLLGEDFEMSIEHLKRKRITEASKESNAKHIAKVLLNFHSEFVWVSRVGADPSKCKRRHESQESTDSGRKRRCANGTQFPHITSTFPLPRHDGGRAAEHFPESQPFSEPTESGSIGTSSIPYARQSSADDPHDTILRDTPVPTQQREQVLDLIPRDNIDNGQDSSRFETLVTAACSANPTDPFGEGPLGMTSEFVGRTSSAPTHGNLLDVTALDFVCPLSSGPNQGNLNMADLDFVGSTPAVPTQENLLDVTNLDFTGPASAVPTQENLLDVTNLDFVGPTPAVPTQDNLLDIWSLDFVGPTPAVPTQENLPDITNLDFVCPI